MDELNPKRRQQRAKRGNRESSAGKFGAPKGRVERPSDLIGSNYHRFIVPKSQPSVPPNELVGTLRAHYANIARLQRTLRSTLHSVPRAGQKLLTRQLAEARGMLASALKRAPRLRRLSQTEQFYVDYARRRIREATEVAASHSSISGPLAYELAQIANDLERLVIAARAEGDLHGARPSRPPPSNPNRPSEPTSSPSRVPTRDAAETPPVAQPQIHARFDGYSPRRPLPVNVRVPLVVWVGAEHDPRRDVASAPFTYRFPKNRARAEFRVTAEADSPDWTVTVVESTLVVARPGQTVQDATFLVMARTASRCRLYINVQHSDTGADVQHMIVTVEAAQPVEANQDEPDTVASPGDDAAETRQRKKASSRSLRSATPGTLARDDAAASQKRVEPDTGAPSRAPEPLTSADETLEDLDDVVVIGHPVDSPEPVRSTVRLLFVRKGDATSYHLRASVDSAQGRIEQQYAVPLTVEHVQAATQRVREELEKAILFRDGDDYPFANPYRVTVDEQLARQVAVPLADAGQVLWAAIFDSPDGDPNLRDLANEIRALPPGSTIQIDLDDKRFIVPWTLLYDAPGEITPETLDWSGFWGYRYAINVLLPGRYPVAQIPVRAPVLKLLLHGGTELERFTRAQVKYLEKLGVLTHTVHHGPQAVSALTKPWNTAMVYCYCHGDQNRDAQGTWLPTDASLSFGDQARARLAELRRRRVAEKGRQPLIFLNTCEGAAVEPFFFDGFVSYCLQERGARAFIGSEVKTPQFLAQHLAQRFWQEFAAGRRASEILWELRQSYIDEHHNVAALTYTLYGLGDTRLTKSLITP
jgi:hypothetical protein